MLIATVYTAYRTVCPSCKGYQVIGSAINSVLFLLLHLKQNATAVITSIPVIPVVYKSVVGSCHIFDRILQTPGSRKHYY